MSPFNDIKFKSGQLVAVRSKIVKSYKLFVLSLACSLRLLLALYAGLFVVLSLTKLGKDTRTSTLTLKTTECAVKRLALFYFNFCHLFSLPSLLKQVQ